MKLVVLSTALSLLLPTGLILAQGPEEPLIEEIIVEGGITLTVDTVSYYIGLEPEDPFIPEEIAEGFHRLWESGLFEDIRIEMEPLENGNIKLYIIVEERPFVSSVVFEGAKKVSASTIKDKLDELGLEVPRNVPLRMAMLSRLETAVKEIYDAEGYRSAKVGFRVEKVTNRERRVVFDIDEGAKVKIAKISFAGNESYSDRRLRWALKEIKEKSFWRFMGSKIIFSDESWDTDRDNLRKFYQDRGHIDIKIGKPEIELVAKRPNARTLKKKKFRLHISVPVEEGEPYSLGDMRIEGAEVFDPNRLINVFDVESGKRYRNKSIEEGIETIQNFYQNTGYVYSYVHPVMERREGDERIVDVVIDVFEGDQFRLGRLEFSGNRVTRDKVLRREFHLPEGSLMNMGLFRSSVYKVNALGFWKLEEEPVEFDFDDENKRVNVVVKGNEVGRNDIQFGAGYSELDGFFGQLMFNTRNFLGRGDTLGVSLQTGRRTDYYTLSFTEPYFMDRRIIVGGSLFKTNLELNDFYRETTGVSMTVGMGLGMYGSLSALLAFEDVYSEFAVSQTGLPGGSTGGHERPWDLPPVEPEEEERNIDVYEGRTVSLTPSYGRDSRDDPFDPNRGMKILLRTRYAGGILGGDYDYFRPEVTFTLFKSLTKKTVVAFNIEGGQFLTFDDSEIPIYERYRLGGDRSLRGIPYYSVLPRTEDGRYFYTERGSQVGGDRYWLLNLEYQLRLGGPVKLVLFADTGNTYHEDQGWDFSLFRKTTGIELRVFLPIFQAPIRFIYGYNIDPFPEEDTGDFQFSIGTTF
jgi:outer membrane protein insertion porin family